MLITLNTGCSATKYIPVESSSRDTITVTNTITYRDTFIVTGSPDTVSIATRDTSSFIRLGDAESEASISNGLLYHELRLAPHKTLVKIPTITIEKESVSFREKQIPYKVEVEKRVTPDWAYWSLGANLILIILIILRVAIKLRR